MASLLLLVALFSFVWLASLLRRDASLVDRWWGVAFAAVAWNGIFTRGDTPIPWPAALLVVLVTVWALRLSLYLTVRNWGKGEDYRYAEMRARRGARFPLWSLFGVFWLQAALAWIIARPIDAALAPGAAPGPMATVLAELGLGVWIVGFGFETVGDWQLARHRADPARRGTVLDTGLWRYTRHPNYFGDAMVWWGHWLVAAGMGAAWTVFAPVVMTLLLLRVSGVTLLEKKLTETRPAYRDYAARTSAFLPLPPRRQA